MKNRTIFTGLGFLLGGLLVIQAIPVPRTNPPVQMDMPAPPEVKAILRTSCYDCHSNETVWPWYSRVAPVSWLVYRDTRAGRRRLNFSTWNNYSADQQAVLLAGSMRRIRNGRMPPWFYTIKHTDGKITPDKLAVLEAWASKLPQ
jgi:hypothetical protein